MEKEHPLQGQEQERRQEQVKESVDRGRRGKMWVEHGGRSSRSSRSNTNRNRDRRNMASRSRNSERPNLY